MVEYELCSLCKLNFGNGRKHSYSKSHQNRVKVVLEKHRNRVKDVRFFLDNVRRGSGSVVPTTHWCYFCEAEVTDHGEFACYHTIVHLASSEHKHNVEDFFRKNRVSIDKRKLYVLSDEVCGNFVDTCERLLRGEKEKKQESTPSGQVVNVFGPLMVPRGVKKATVIGPRMPPVPPQSLKKRSFVSEQVIRHVSNLLLFYFGVRGLWNLPI